MAWFRRIGGLAALLTALLLAACETRPPAASADGDYRKIERLPGGYM